MTSARHWTPEAIENVFDAQGLRLAPGRAAKIATGLNAAAGLADPLLGTLEFETDPTAYALTLGQHRSK